MAPGSSLAGHAAPTRHAGRIAGDGARPGVTRPASEPGATWRDMPARFGNSNTAYKRYRLWSDTGLWERLLRALRSGTHQDAADVSL